MNAYVPAMTVYVPQINAYVRVMTVYVPDINDYVPNMDVDVAVMSAYVPMVNVDVAVMTILAADRIFFQRTVFVDFNVLFGGLSKRDDESKNRCKDINIV